MVRVRYTAGFCRVYGIEFHPMRWTEVSDTIVKRVENSADWDVEGAEPVEEVVEVVEEAVEETSDDTDLSALTKKELQGLCDEAGLTYKSLDTKAALISLLDSGDEEE